MTTGTIILITWFLAGLIGSLLIIYYAEEDFTYGDILPTILFIILGYLTLTFTIIILIIKNVKLPKSDTILWKHPKNR